MTALLYKWYTINYLLFTDNMESKFDLDYLSGQQLVFSKFQRNLKELYYLNKKV